jgi:hypothetical protein
VVLHIYAMQQQSSVGTHVTTVFLLHSSSIREACLLSNVCEWAHIALYELGMDTKEDNLMSNVRSRIMFILLRHIQICSQPSGKGRTTSRVNTQYMHAQDKKTVTLP